MKRIHEINCLLDDWEEQAAMSLNVGPTCKDDLIAIQDHVKFNHQGEIADILLDVEREQASNGSDVDEYTPQDQKDHVSTKSEALEALHDRLSDFL